MSKQHWHFLGPDKKLNHGDGREVVVGETLSVEGEIVPCENALHAGVTPLDALRYAPPDTKYACYVEVWGDAGEKDHERIVYGRHRKVLWMVDCERTLHEFAIWCAEEALKLIENPDPRSVHALEVKKLWLNGEATDEELDEAAKAARAAAKTTWDTSWNAEWAARAAARAAWASTWATTGTVRITATPVAATWTALAEAAWAAAWVAAQVAAWATTAERATEATTTAEQETRTKQNRKLEQMLVEARRVTEDTTNA